MYRTCFTARLLTLEQAEWKRQADAAPMYDDYDASRPILIADASDFEIYRTPDAGIESRRFELISLHHLEVPTATKLCFDGFLCIGSTRRYVQGLTIRDSSVEGYGDSDSPLVV
jgi:DNA (cytosine-5)-methyltransferase 1